MAHQIHIYIDHQVGQVLAGSWEAVGAGRELAESLGGELTGVVLGSDVEGLADAALEHGVDRVVLVEDPQLEEFRAEPYSTALAAALEGAEVVLFPDSGRTRDLAGMAAADLETGVVPDVTELHVEEDRILATRPIYAGKLLSRVEIPDATPKLFTLRNRAFEAPVAPDKGAGGIERLAVDLPPAKSEVVGYKEGEETVSLTDAAVIVSGGRGVANNPELEPPPDLSDDKEREVWRAHQGFDLVRELAEVLGAAVGASRAAVDAGYIPYAQQVGQTGKVVTPDLYIACGISGAIQHLAGMRTAKNIVAINVDGEAPIFKLCRFGVVGDLYEVLPSLTEALREEIA